MVSGAGTGVHIRCTLVRVKVALVQRWKWSLFAYMFVVAIAAASWVTRTPAIRDAIQASTATMGLVLFGLSIGSMAGVLSSGHLVRRFGTRPVIATSAVFVTIAMAVVAVATGLGTAPGVFAGLLLFGIGVGLAEIALNIDGAVVEARLARPVLPALHGCYSLGVFVGALLGMAATAAHLPAAWHLGACAVLVALVSVWVVRGLPEGTGRDITSTQAVPDPEAVPSSASRSVWLDPRLLLLGVVLLGLALAEGAANDWLPLMMVDGLGLKAAQGSLVFAAFAGVMAIGRFGGQPLITRLGKQRVLLGSVATATVGVLLVSQAGQPAFVVIGVLLWGLGVALGFPVAISMAGDNPDRPEQRVSTVATCGYIAFLVGPPLLGFVGEQHGLRSAMLVVVAMLLASAGAAVARGQMTKGSE